VELPEIQYAWSGDVAIAYQVLGDGPIDLVFVPFISNLYANWQYPPNARFYERLAEFTRLILLDKRGSGLSDRPRGVATLEMQMDDLRAVLDAVHSKTTALLGAYQGAQTCALFAASYPERVRALALYCPHVNMSSLPPYHTQSLDDIRRSWGTKEYANAIIERFDPDADAAYRDWLVTEQRLAASPGAAVAFFRMFYESDITDVLPSIRTPTIVLYRAPVREAALEVAEGIRSATAIELPGPERSVFADFGVTSEVERFLAEGGEHLVPESVLATVLFIDLVDSTRHVVALGNRAWRDLLQQHEHSVRRALSRFRGVELDTAGDGIFASFDGPARAILCAQSIVASARELDLEVRAGLHTGECERHGSKLAGITVNIGARIAALADPGEILVSSTVTDLVAGSGIQFQDRDTHELKGVPGKWRLYAVATSA
jgi:class 3 adenylate cyclase